jgi:hypothetical protein
MNTADWQYLYDERAAIAEHVYNLNRATAEAVAWKAILEAGCSPFFQRTIKRTI